jgi:hypothetical protein
LARLRFSGELLAPMDSEGGGSLSSHVAAFHAHTMDNALKELIVATSHLHLHQPLRYPPWGGKGEYRLDQGIVKGT